MPPGSTLAALPPATAEAMAAIFAPLADRPRETCVALYLDRLGRLTGMRHMVGTSQQVEVPIRSIVVDALGFDARAALLAHNHPSGNAQASRDDLLFTRRLVQALTTIGVDLVDHVILTRGGATTSLRATGFL